MIRLLRGIEDLITATTGRPQPELQESLASNWVAMKLRVMRGEIDPGAPVYVAELQPGRGSGYMTLQSVLKTVEEGWGHWDRKTMTWWCEVLDRANNGSIGDV
ncbi:MAG: hypothetical protein E3J29_06415 [Dehalococcoidia bacterium]|nr:MAG: hypothetical protein E3J29_06415 [Dehalococcoidia bacterium]